MAKIALGTSSEAAQPDCLRALVVEFVCTFIFVFVGVASAMATGMFLKSLTNDYPFSEKDKK